ncbi:MAG: choice-of-anchor B family protein, partial [Bacteroidota bacterium]
MFKRLLFVCCLGLSFGLSAQDISSNMIFHSSYDDDTLPTHSFGTFNDVWGYAANGREYAFMGSAAYIHVFDVTDPKNLQQLAQIPGGETTVWRDFKTYKDHLYAVSDGTTEGLIVFDLAHLPDSMPITYQNTEFFNNTHNIFIDQTHGRLYNTNSPVQVLDVDTDPAQPTLLKNLILPVGDGIHDLFVIDHMAYLSSGFDGMFIYDLTDLDNPVLKARLETNGYNHSGWLTEDGQTMIVAEEITT